MNDKVSTGPIELMFPDSIDKIGIYINNEDANTMAQSIKMLMDKLEAQESNMVFASVYIELMKLYDLLNSVNRTDKKSDKITFITVSYD